MTEEQAKTKLCCGPPSIAASNYYRAGVDCDAPAHCIASACMAWRTRRDEVHTSTTGGTFIHTELSGYCGLAGQPS